MCQFSRFPIFMSKWKTNECNIHHSGIYLSFFFFFSSPSTFDKSQCGKQTAAQSISSFLHNWTNVQQNPPYVVCAQVHSAKSRTCCWTASKDVPWNMKRWPCFLSFFLKEHSLNRDMWYECKCIKKSIFHNPAISWFILWLIEQTAIRPMWLITYKCSLQA